MVIPDDKRHPATMLQITKFVVRELKASGGSAEVIAFWEEAVIDCEAELIERQDPRVTD